MGRGLVREPSICIPTGTEGQQLRFFFLFRKKEMEKSTTLDYWKEEVVSFQEHHLVKGFALGIYWDGWEMEGRWCSEMNH